MKTAGEENRTIAARSLQIEHVVLNTGADEFEEGREFMGNQVRVFGSTLKAN
jgi:hypothetical protein